MWPGPGRRVATGQPDLGPPAWEQPHEELSRERYDDGSPAAWYGDGSATARRLLGTAMAWYGDSSETATATAGDDGSATAALRRRRPAPESRDGPSP